ncbi:hypothetical protein ACFYZB_43140 [Streptomyces sp. NPDC001852]|uniref:hypothetical protein n=1 Tax=Streptomyces sp. NPDC001852 TaxID=3364619 RepID=UPI0036773C2A
MWHREGRSVRAEVLAATLCACVVEVLAVRQLRLRSFRHPGRPVWLPFRHALLVLVCLVAAQSLPRLLRHPLVCRPAPARGRHHGRQRTLATRRGLDRGEGHAAGGEALFEVVYGAVEI